MQTPRDIAQRVEEGVDLPSGTEERFSGYGLMGLPFTSGHILGLRRFPASSVGAGYTSVWHRNSGGEWTFYQDVPPPLACPRYFGSDLARAFQVDEIRIEWPGTHEFTVSMKGDQHLEWHVSLATTPATWLMNSMSRMIPDPLWRNSSFLRVMGGMASIMLGAGHLGLAGKTPNGQSFVANPRQIWRVASSAAVVEGEDVGTIGPLQQQARLGDFWIPQRGIFARGSAMFDSYDPVLHVLRTSKTEAAASRQ